ncbi:MAG: hypothetical protein PHQ27_04300, partial [Victivallales bacterium]|nr:hypothetical protein [Victivallales bacterium]
TGKVDQSDLQLLLDNKADNNLFAPVTFTYAAAQSQTTPGIYAITGRVVPVAVYKRAAGAVNWTQVFCTYCDDENTYIDIRNIGDYAATTEYMYIPQQGVNDVKDALTTQTAELTDGTIVLRPDRTVYHLTVTDATVITIDGSNIPAGPGLTFQLLLDFQVDSPSLTWTNINWIGDNLPPDGLSGYRYKYVLVKDSDATAWDGSYEYRKVLA